VSTPAADRPIPDQPHLEQPATASDQWSGGYGPAPVPAYPVAPAGRERAWVPEALVGLGLAVVVAALGFPLGWLWSKIAPHAPAVITPDGPAYAAPNQEQLIGDEGWYVFLAVGAGIVVAVLAWLLLRRYRGVGVVLGLAAGGTVAGVLTFWTGHHIGLARARDLVEHGPVGTRFLLPVNLRVEQLGLWHGWVPYVRGDLFCLAITAVIVYVLIIAFSAYPDLRPPPRGLRT
jgi:hypothetical protein